jgi:hypothetical protein
VNPLRLVVREVALTGHRLAACWTVQWNGGVWLGYRRRSNGDWVLRVLVVVSRFFVPQSPPGRRGHHQNNGQGRHRDARSVQERSN